MNEATSRRRFVEQLAATLAAPVVLPGVVFGKTAPSEKIALGMIGMGRQALNVNLPTFLSHPYVHVAAVCDVDAWRLDNAKQRVDQNYQNTDCAAYRDFREVLALHSIQTGRLLRWDPKREIFPDDPDANRLLSRPMRAPWRI